MVDSTWTVRSINFDWHEPAPASSYDDAIRVAKARGWEASILQGGKLVASWSPLYGVRVHNWNRYRAAMKAGAS